MARGRRRCRVVWVRELKVLRIRMVQAFNAYFFMFFNLFSQCIVERLYALDILARELPWRSLQRIELVLRRT